MALINQGAIVTEVRRPQFREVDGRWLIGSHQYSHLAGFEYIRQAIEHHKVSSLDLVDAIDPTMASNKVAPAVRRALQKIREQDPATGAHLEDSITTGFYVTYVGGRDWEL